MGCYYYICTQRFPTTIIQRRGIAVPRFRDLIKVLMATGEQKNLVI
nr:MAG TPA: hypothetical protein [Caudoviricetes sp.]